MRGKDGPGSRGERTRGKGGYVGENKGNGDADDEKEKDAARSFVSFSSEKETKELWPPSLLHISRRCLDGSGSGVSVHTT